MKRFLYYTISLILGLLLTGCTALELSSAPQTHYDTLPWAKRKQALSKIQLWSTRGAFSILQEGKATIAAYEWHQQKQAYEIRIHSSLDLYSVIITGEAGHVTLSRSAHDKTSATTPQQLMQKELGWSLPLENLNYWMRGLPGPGPHTSQHDAYGHLTRLDQQGWSIAFSRYTSIENVDLPQMLILDHGKLHVKIIIKQWTLR